MRGINRIFILGRIGHDPELKKTANNHSYTLLRIATNRPIRRDDSWEEITDWHQVRTWDNNAELCVQMIKKGAPIAVEGHLRTDSWIDPQGEKRSKTYVHADKIHFLPNKRNVAAK